MSPGNTPGGWRGLARGSARCCRYRRVAIRAPSAGCAQPAVRPPVGDAGSGRGPVHGVPGAARGGPRGLLDRARGLGPYPGPGLVPGLSASSFHLVAQGVAALLLEASAPDGVIATTSGCSHLIPELAELVTLTATASSNCPSRCGPLLTQVIGRELAWGRPDRCWCWRRAASDFRAGRSLCGDVPYFQAPRFFAQPRIGDDFRDRDQSGHDRPMRRASDQATAFIRADALGRARHL